MRRSVSVVIPVRNEAAALPRLFDSLAAQTFQAAEIVVIDGGSSDATAECVRAFAENDPRIRFVEAGPATPGRGRNVGIAAARHDWIALTDAGAWPEPRWLAELVAAAEREPDAMIVYGNYEPVIDTFFAGCAALAYVAPKRNTIAGAVRGPSTASLLLARELWELVGGFPDWRAGEDLVFMERVAERGVPIAWAPGATVWWQMQPSLASTFRRFVLYSRHNVWAGLQNRWHYGLARQYAAAAGLVALAVAHDWRWALALPAGLAVRTARRLWRYGGANPGRWHANALQFFGVAAVTLTIDAAAFVGWGQALVRKAPRARRE